MAIQFSNLASTTLASGVSSSATSVSVTSASLFPSLGGSDYFYATLGDGTGSEIVKVTAISGTTFTVVRAQDGTSAISHNAGTHFALRVTAAALEDLRDSPNVESVSKSGDTMTGTLAMGANAITSTGTINSGAITSTGVLTANAGATFGASVGIVASGAPAFSIQDSDGTNQLGTIGHNGGETSFTSRNNTGNGSFKFYTHDGSTFTDRFNIASSGAATFASSVSATEVRVGNLVNNGTISANAVSGKQALTAKVQNNGNSIFQGFNASDALITQITGAGALTHNGNATFSGDAIFQGNVTHNNNNASSKYFRLNVASSGDGHLLLQRNNQNSWQIHSDSSNVLKFDGYNGASSAVFSGSVTSTGLTVDGGSNGQIDFGDVTSAYGRLYADSTGTFIGSKSNHPLILRTNNTERLRIGSTGIIYVNGDATGGRLSGDGSGGLVLQDGNGRQSFKIMSPSSGSVQAMTLDASSNLGIGTSSPNGNGILTLNTPANNSAQIVFAENDTAKWLIGHRHDGDHFRFYDLANSAERMRINADGSSVFSGSVTSTGQINAGTNLVAGTSVYSGNGIYYGSSTLSLKNSSSGSFLDFASNGNATFNAGATFGDAISTLSNDNGITFQSSQSANNRVQIFFKDHAGAISSRVGNDISGDNAHQLQFIAGTGSTPQLTIASSGAATFAGDVSVPNISVADDIRHSGDSDTYLSFESNYLGMYTNGKNTLVLNDGNVNIPDGKIKVSATTAPVARVDIAGNSDTVPALKIGSGDTYGHFFYDSSATGDLVIKRGEGGSQSESMRLDRGNGNATFSGSVGINRTPSISNSKLEVGGADNVSLINVEASGVTGGMGIGSSGLQFFHGSSSKMAIDSGGHTSFTLGTNAMGTFGDSIGEVGSGNFSLQVTNSAGSALKPLGFRAEDIRFATGSTERLRITDASTRIHNSLMVGATTAPSGKLHIKNGASGATYTADGADQVILENNDSMMMDIRTPSGNTGGILFSDNNARGRGIIQYAHSNDTMYINTAGASALTLDSSQNASFSGAVNAPTLTGVTTINTASSLGVLEIYGGATNKGGKILLSGGNNTSNGSDIRFHTGASTANPPERMRINSSGDWMVSNTVANTASAYATQAGCGWVESDTHFEIATTSNRSALEIGKNNANDGELLVFRKQSNVVGSLGTISQDSQSNFFIGFKNASQGVGLGFGHSSGTGRAYYPCREDGSGVSGAIDLGTSTYKYKDLHLSGTANVGAVTADDLALEVDGASSELKFVTGGSFRSSLSYNNNTGLMILDNKYSAVDIHAGASGTSSIRGRFNSSGLTVTGTINSGTIISTGKVQGNSLRAHVGTDDGSQLNLFADASGHCFIAGHTLRFNVGSNNARATKLYIDSVGAATFSSSVLGTIINAGASSSVGVGAVTADANVAELGSGYLNLGRDDVADAAQIAFSKGGILHSSIVTSNNDLHIKGNASNLGIRFDGLDGSNVITALRLDIANAGAATFNSSVASDTFLNASGNLDILSTQSVLIKFDSDNNQTNREFNIQANNSTQLFKIDENGAMTHNGTASFAGAITIPDKIIHAGDTNTYFGFNAPDQIQLVTGGVERVAFYNTETHFNDGGTDVDFIVESLGNANMLFVDGGANKVGIGDNPTDNGSTLQVTADATVSGDLQFVMRGDTDNNKKLVMGFDTTTNIASISSFTAGTSHNPLHLQGSEFVWNEAGSNHDFRVASDSYSSCLHVNAGDNSVNFHKAVTSVNTSGFTIGQPAAGVTSSMPSGNTYHVYRSDGVDNGYKFYVHFGGQINSTSTSISSLSDERLKENIVDLETGLTEVIALKPRRFDWKGNGNKNVAGFIAQEVETVLPELIGDFLHDDLADAKSVKMGDMVPTLVKAIQEQQTLIEKLTARITALEE